MTNIDLNRPSFFDPGRHEVPLTDVLVFEPVHHGRRNRILTLTAAAAIALAVGMLQYGQASSRPVDAASTSRLATGVQVRDAYAPGGSVYRQQVPSAADSPDMSAYAPGGSVYEQQVPER